MMCTFHPKWHSVGLSLGIKVSKENCG